MAKWILRIILLSAALALTLGTDAAQWPGSYQPTDPMARMGVEADAQGLARLLSVQPLSGADRAALQTFANGYTIVRSGPGRGTVLPADLENVIVAHFRDPDPWIGLQLHAMLQCAAPAVSYRQRALFDVMLEELKAGSNREADFFEWSPSAPGHFKPIPPPLRRSDAFIVCTDLPGIEADLLGLLDNGHSLNRQLASAVMELLARRHYEPAVPVLIRLQARAAPDSWIAGNISAALLQMESAASLEAVRLRLRWLQAQPSGEAVSRETASITVAYQRALVSIAHHRASGFVPLLASHYDLASPMPADALSDLLIGVANREALDALVQHLAWLATQARGGKAVQAYDTLLHKLALLPASAPLDTAALHAALTPDLLLGNKNDLLDMTARRNEAASPSVGPWPTRPVTMTREQCEQTRDHSYPQDDACFGVFSGRHEVLDACAAYRPDFGQSCGHAPFITTSALHWAGYARDEYALLKMLDSGAAPPYPGALTGLAEGCVQHLDALPWCQRVMQALVRRGADINEVIETRDGAGSTFRTTPLLTANASGDPKALALLDILISLGADVNRQDSHGCTALDAARFGQLGTNLWPEDHGPNAARVSYLLAHHAQQSLGCAARRLMAMTVQGATAAAFISGCMLGGCPGH